MNPILLNTKIDIDHFTFNLALSTPHSAISSSSLSSSKSFNSLPFLEFDLSNFHIGMTLLSDASYFKIKISLQDFEIYEISPSPILPNISLHRINSTASFSYNNSLPLGGAQARTYSFDVLGERTGYDTVHTGSPCPSVYDSMGVSDVRSGHKYVRILSRRYEREIIPQIMRKNSKCYGTKHGSKSLFSPGKLPRGGSASDFQQKNNNDVNIYNIHEDYNSNRYYNNHIGSNDDNSNYSNSNRYNNNFNNKNRDNSNSNNNTTNDNNNNNNYYGNRKSERTPGLQYVDSLLPLFSLEFEHSTQKTNFDHKNNDNNNADVDVDVDNNNDKDDIYEKNTNNDGIDNDNNNNNKKNNDNNDSINNNNDNNNDKSNISNNGNYKKMNKKNTKTNKISVSKGHFFFTMEELEILFSPSSKWLAAMGTFFALPSPFPSPSNDEYRYYFYSILFLFYYFFYVCLFFFYSSSFFFHALLLF